MPPQPQPTHDLADVRSKVRVGFVTYRREALDDAASLELSREDIDECLLALTETDFYKTMPAEHPKWKGCMQDVYRPTYGGYELYVKFQLFPGNRLHVLSFKRKN